MATPLFLRYIFAIATAIKGCLKVRILADDHGLVSDQAFITCSPELIVYSNNRKCESEKFQLDSETHSVLIPRKLFRSGLLVK